MSIFTIILWIIWIIWTLYTILVHCLYYKKQNYFWNLVKLLSLLPVLFPYRDLIKGHTKRYSYPESFRTLFLDTLSKFLMNSYLLGINLIEASLSVALSVVSLHTPILSIIITLVPLFILFIDYYLLIHLT